MAVYTEIADDELDRLVGAYDIGRLLSCKGIAEGVENSNFLLHTESGYFILTLYEKRVKREDLPFFLGLMEHLASQGFVSPTPIRGRDGEVLREAAGRPSAIIAFLEGRSLKRPDPAHCALVGQAMARMHIVGADFAMKRRNDLSLDGWRKLIAACGGQADEVEPGLARELAEELEFLGANWPEGLPGGVIHADLFPDNVFFLDDRLNGVIDYYFACNDFYAYDIAVCLNAWCFEPDLSFNITKARKLLAAYAAERPLNEAELDALPVLARGAAMRFLATRLYDWLNRVDGALVRPKNPDEYIAKLRFHREVHSRTAYGLD